MLFDVSHLYSVEFDSLNFFLAFYSLTLIVIVDYVAVVFQ